MYKFQSIVTDELKENLREKINEILIDCDVKSAAISVEYDGFLEKVSIELIYVSEKVDGGD